MEEDFVKILGVAIPHIVIPVAPGVTWPAGGGGGVPGQTQARRLQSGEELNDRLIAKMAGKENP